MARSTDLTKGNITRGLWGFALPLMLGNVITAALQSCRYVGCWTICR